MPDQNSVCNPFCEFPLCINAASRIITWKVRLSTVTNVIFILYNNLTINLSGLYLIWFDLMNKHFSSTNKNFHIILWTKVHCKLTLVRDIMLRPHNCKLMLAWDIDLKLIFLLLYLMTKCQCLTLIWCWLQMLA